MAQAIPRTDDQLSAEIAAFASLTTPQLKEHSRALYRAEPPPRASRDFLRRAVAYRIQERALGGLSVSTRRLLERIAGDATQRSVRIAPTRKLHVGAILLREWGGVQHQVELSFPASAPQGGRCNRSRPVWSQNSASEFVFGFLDLPT
jgi:hypothetical protein